MVENPPADLVTQGIIYEHFSNKILPPNKPFGVSLAILKQPIALMLGYQIVLHHWGKV
jgi:hypothetical protein